MAFIDGTLYFAPGIAMKDLDLDNPAFVLDAFERRVDGLFLAPIRSLDQGCDVEEGALFAAALLVAALIESLARVETGSTEQGTLIKQWLESNIGDFKSTVILNGQSLTLADIFEYRFRNGLAHNGYVASLGRLSRATRMPVSVSGDIVTVNPFALAVAVAVHFKTFAGNLRSGVRDIRRFAHYVGQQFQDEVERARAEAAAG